MNLISVVFGLKFSISQQFVQQNSCAFLLHPNGGKLSTNKRSTDFVCVKATRYRKYK